MIVDEIKLGEFGREFSKSLVPGSVVALVGDLGAGKTTLTKAIADGLGVTDPVTSPTFTIINEYGGGRLPLYHFDVYRLAGPGVYDALDDIGWEEYFYGEGVCVVEWADEIQDVLPPDAVRIHLAQTDSPSRREVTFL
ncbi:MAG: tRNA (adenosine(37)-N6)-threonylcarbamoyltransferase complex ATPase subunit type 1 TsaE [Clostridiales Family XIII bacterium]|jgi:tRNA threonylcarbamoyladenosine biosynthesis protein TsaE|nr:tRNA (adenosine(37)-N6)-threonylcarbamoyltransferase complex ATPase subunit type 1 TsaE [Clostridiales Family XIII bacterium]